MRRLMTIFLPSTGTDIIMNAKPTLKSKIDMAKKLSIFAAFKGSNFRWFETLTTNYHHNRREREAMRRARRGENGGSSVSDSIFGEEFKPVQKHHSSSPSNPFDAPTESTSFSSSSSSSSYSNIVLPPLSLSSSKDSTSNYLEDGKFIATFDATMNLNDPHHLDDPYLAPLSASIHAPNYNSNKAVLDNPFE